MRRRGRAEHASVGNALLFLAGVAVGTLAVVSPLDELAEETLLSAHMAQHLLLGDRAPLLIVLGLRGPIAFFLLPPAVLRPLAPSRAAPPPARRASPPRRLARRLGDHTRRLALPRAYDAAFAHPALHVTEHASLFLGSLLLWTQIVDPTHPHRLTPGRRAAFAATALFGGMILGEVLLASAPLYAHYADATDRPLGLTYRTDQDRAALLMMAEQIATLGSAAALLFWSHVENLESELAAQR